MSAPYRVEVNVGTYGLSSQEDDPAGYGLTDGLELKRSVPSVDLAPLVQQNAQEATFGIIAPDATTYQFKLGDQVRVAIYNNHSGGNGYYFWGRVANLQAQPHKLGILYSFTCVDYLADLEELKAGRVDYPVETAQARCNRMLAENGIGPLVVEGITPTNNPSVSARVAATEGSVGLMEALEEVLAGWTESQVNNEVGSPSTNVITTRYELQPNIVNPGGVVGQGTLDTTSPFKLTPIYRPQGWTPPARLVSVPSYRLTVSTAQSSPSTQNLVLDAGQVEFAPLFTQEKGNAITRVVVQVDSVGYAMADWATWGTYQYLIGTGALEATVKVRETALNLGAVTAAMYRGTIQPDTGLAWTVGEIVWRAGRTQAASWQGPQLRRVCTIARVDAVNASSHVPTNKAWITGVVDGLRIRVESGEVLVAFTLAPMHETQGGALVVPHQMTLAQVAVVNRTNLVPSPSMEDASPESAWIANAGTTLTKDTTTPWVGTKRLKVVATNENWGYYPMDGLVQSGMTRPTHTVGQQYTASVWVHSPVAQTLALIDYGSANVQGASVAVAANTWTRLSLTWTAGANVFLSVRNPNRTTVVGTIYLDGFMIETGGTLGAYFDGATAPAGINVYAWTGTADLSTSTESGQPTYANLDPSDTFADYLLAYA